MDGVSRTADLICLFRALERLRPPQHWILDDPFAEHLVSPESRRWLSLCRRWPKLVSTTNVISAYVSDYSVLRHRYFDDEIIAALATQSSQLVLLGAGMDTRYQRLAEQWPAGFSYFELDSPDTSQKKQNLIEQKGWPQPIFVPTDFRRGVLQANLRKAGFQEGARSICVMEGVSMYLTPEDVASTLRAMRALVGFGSIFLADFYTHRKMDPISFMPRLPAFLLGWLREAIRSTFSAEQLQHLAELTGWSIQTVLDAEGLRARYPQRESRLFSGCLVAKLVAV